MIRDDEGNWIACYSTNLECCSIDEVEAWTILNGLQVAWDKGKDQIMVMCDSRKVIDALSHKDYKRDNYLREKNIIKECWKMLKKQ